MKAAAILFSMFLMITFFLAAKTHGRQYRLERELQGHWSVSFTSQNHPWVESFWFRHRMIYWSVAAATETVLIARFIRKKPKWNLYAFLLSSVAASMIVAFVFTGLLSAVRLAVRVFEEPSLPEGSWLNDAIWGSVGLWGATFVSVALLLLSARKWFVLSLHR